LKSSKPLLVPVVREEKERTRKNRKENTKKHRTRKTEHGTTEKKPTFKSELEEKENPPLRDLAPIGNGGP
jgi:hypothetical protein